MFTVGIKKFSNTDTNYHVYVFRNDTRFFAGIVNIYNMRDFRSIEFTNETATESAYYLNTINNSIVIDANDNESISIYEIGKHARKMIANHRDMLIANKKREYRKQFKTQHSLRYASL